MVEKVKSLNINKIASLIHKDYPELKVKDIKKTLDALQEMIEFGLDTGQEVKLGNTFKLCPQWLETRKQYDGISKKHKTLPRRMRIKFKPLTRLHRVEKDSEK